MYVTFAEEIVSSSSPHLEKIAHNTSTGEVTLTMNREASVLFKRILYSGLNSKTQYNPYNNVSQR